MAGVLIALFVDGWRQEQADLRREAEALRAIQFDLASDSVFLAREVDRLPGVIRALRSLYDMDPDALPPSPEVAELLSATATYAWGDGTTTAFTTLGQTGEIRLIRDPVLLRQISRYYNETLSALRRQNALDSELNLEFNIFDSRVRYDIVGHRGPVEDKLVLDPGESRAAISQQILRPENFARWLRERRGYLFSREQLMTLVWLRIRETEEARAALNQAISDYLADR